MITSVRKTISAPESRPEPIAHRGAAWELAVLVLLLSLHPIVAADFWWHLARGRAVAEGHLAPSASLLAFEPHYDADWLGGLPWYGLYSMLGASLLCCAVAVSVLLLANLLAAKVQYQPAGIALIVLGLTAARDAFAPTPAFVDLFGTITTWTVAGQLRRRFRWRQVIAIFVCVWLWANFASLPLIGLLVTWARMNLEHVDSPRVNLRLQLGVLGGCVIAASVTPRGLHTLWDSGRVLLPWTVVDLGTLGAAGILPDLTRPLSAEMGSLLLLLGFHFYWLFQFHRSPGRARRVDVLILAISIVIAGSAQANVPPVSLFLTAWGLQHLPVRYGVQQQHSGLLPRLKRLSLDYGTLVACAVLAIGIGGGLWPGSQTRLGWGIAPRLEPALIEYAMADIKLQGTAYCSGAREAGLVAWLRPGPIRPADITCRAVLSDRLQEHLRIRWDLAHGWRDEHRRSDGTWGGWLRPLQSRNTQLLFIAAEDVEVLSKLTPSFWKPLAIDTPSIPYAFADTPVINRRIVSVASLLDLVDAGAWTYTPPPAAGAGSHFDLWGWITRKHERAIDLRQARVLKAMNRQLAAIKLLVPGLQAGDRRARQEFRDIQLALAYNEFLETGQATSWRMLAYLACGGDPSVLRTINPARQTVPTCLPHGFLQAVSAYSRGELSAAKSTLSDGHPKSLYALAQISLEQGTPQPAANCFQRLLTRFPCFPESKAALHALPKLPH